MAGGWVCATGKRAWGIVSVVYGVIVFVCVCVCAFVWLSEKCVDKINGG